MNRDDIIFHEVEIAIARLGELNGVVEGVDAILW